MSKLSDLVWRVNGFKGSLMMTKGILRNLPPCASTESYKLAGELSDIAFKLRNQIENDYQEAKKKIQSSNITAK